MLPLKSPATPVLDPALAQRPVPCLDHGTGIIPAQGLRTALARGMLIVAPKDPPIKPDQVQPASLDLRLSTAAWRMPAAVLPRHESDETIDTMVKRIGGTPIDLCEKQTLIRGEVYLVRLMEAVKLPRGISGFANPKSSSGRLDMLCRVIADRTPVYDDLPEGFCGSLYLQITLRSFDITLQAGARLAQLRLRRGISPPTAIAMRTMQQGAAPMIARRDALPLFDRMGQAPPRMPVHDLRTLKDGITLSIDVSATTPSARVGYRAKDNAPPVDIDQRHLNIDTYWEPVTAQKNSVRIEKDSFYILKSREAIQVPEDRAAELVDMDTRFGDFRSHYAGFFDPGFGLASPDTRGVLELRSYETPMILNHEQPIARIVYHPLTCATDTLYGADLGSHYDGQQLRLGKQFL